MGEYVKSKKDMKFQSTDALKTVQSVIDDADLALKDKSRRIQDSAIGEAVAGALGVGVNIAKAIIKDMASNVVIINTTSLCL